MGPEAQLQGKLIRRVKSLGGMAFKLAPTAKGLPDLLVLMPGSGCHLVEMKAETGRLSAAQTLLHRRIQKMGIRVWVVRDAKSMDRFFRATADRAFETSRK